VDPAARRRDALIEAGLALASELSLEALLQKIIDVACEVADARYGALGVLGPEGRPIEQFITHGITEEEYRAIGSLPEGRGILGALIDEARPLRLRRIQDDPRSVGFPPNHPPMTSFLGVPVKVGGRVFGNLYLTEKRGSEEFTSQDREAVETLAAQAAVAVENARLHQEVRRLAVLEDRERIATELHDGAIQSLFALGMSLQAAEGLADPAVRERLTTAVNMIDAVIRDLRNYIFGLRPGGVADVHLERSLRGLAEEFSGGVEIAADVDPDTAARLAGRAADLLQAAREALSNAVRHAGAGRVDLVLRREDDRAYLEVHDDGTGFDPEAVTGRGQGLGNLRARGDRLGGSLEIESGGEGTTVRLTVPL
jgi:signal transduction histidine kinase